MAGQTDDSLLNKELTRKEFLGSMVGLLLLLFGVTNLIAALKKFILSQGKQTTQPTANVSHGFGASKFGR